MGVLRLWSTVRKHRDQFSEVLELPAPPDDGEPVLRATLAPVLVVDASSFAHSMYRQWRLDWRTGGDYAAFVTRMQAWVSMWRRAGIALVWVLDGAKEAEKAETHLARAKDRLSNARQLAAPSVLGRGLPGVTNGELPRGVQPLLPPLVLLAMKQVIRSCAVDTHRRHRARACSCERGRTSRGTTASAAGPPSPSSEPHSSQRACPRCHCWLHCAGPGDVAVFEAPGDADRFVAAVTGEVAAHGRECLGVVTNDTDFLVRVAVVLPPALRRYPASGMYGCLRCSLWLHCRFYRAQP